jgi:hypothetical protein
MSRIAPHGVRSVPNEIQRRITPMTKQDVSMLQSIDGAHRSRLEFEEKCRLRTLARYGVVVRFDNHGMARVDWTRVGDTNAND